MIFHNWVHILNFLVTFLLLTTNTALYYSRTELIRQQPVFFLHQLHSSLQKVQVACRIPTQCINSRTFSSEISCCLYSRILTYVQKEKLQTFKAFKIGQNHVAKHNSTKTLRIYKSVLLYAFIDAVWKAYQQPTKPISLLYTHLVIEASKAILANLEWPTRPRTK